MRTSLGWSLAVFAILCSAVEAKGPCSSQIYCEGDLLHAVQMAKLYPDDKTFVDKPTKQPEYAVLEAFAKIGGKKASRSDIKNFVSTYFGDEGTELKPVNLTELNPNPPFLQRIKNPLLKAYGSTVNGYWSTLIREQDLTKLCDGCVSSMLPLKYHFVVPGGRFREIYYWDTYFTLEGLLRSGLTEKASSNIRDLADLVDRYGFVPNGARVYYLDRSQPPFLTLMVKLYYEHTKDKAFVQQLLPTLKREHAYWLANHSVEVKKATNKCASSVTLARYIVDTDQPRPESYTKDYEMAHNATSDPAKQASIYADMATGAESGWDYSTRWVSNPNAPKDELLYGIRTRQVVPVELNAILYQVEEALASFESLINGHNAGSEYAGLAEKRRQAMEAVFYDKASGLYYDYILEEHRPSAIFSPASLWPYWSFGKKAPRGGAAKAFKYLAEVYAKNPGGIPASLTNSGQQWDWPMVWPPLQYVLMQGALNTGHKQLGSQLAQAFVDTVFCSWYNTGGFIPDVLAQLPGETDSGHMFEKFNSTLVGQEGGGGEYTVQAGFGWTNGVLLWTLDTFGSQLQTPQCPGIKIPATTQQPTSSAPHFQPTATNGKPDNAADSKNTPAKDGDKDMPKIINKDAGKDSGKDSGKDLPKDAGNKDAANKDAGNKGPAKSNKSSDSKAAVPTDAKAKESNAESAASGASSINTSLAAAALMLSISTFSAFH
ncbi:hypothetical protein GGI12_002277 [Dipsacomyces acuminosporus]|nr:hypothetical protein GGI12_002277 [Dipsacomyces acuminosporus]